MRILWFDKFVGNKFEQRNGVKLARRANYMDVVCSPSLRHLTKFPSSILFAVLNNAPVAQLDRVPGYELGGRRFESFRARQINKPPKVVFLFVCFNSGFELETQINNRFDNRSVAKVEHRAISEMARRARSYHDRVILPGALNKQVTCSVIFCLYV